MRFRVLSPVEIETNQRIVGIVRPRERCLLGVLLLDVDHVVPVDRLADLLWDGEPPDRARRTIQGHVSRLRALLADTDAAVHQVALVSVGGGYRMNVTPAAVDAHLFRATLDEQSPF